MFVGIAAVGIYSNYLLIIGAVTMVFTVLFQSVSASIGNLGATQDKAAIEKIFHSVDFVGFWFYGFSSIALFNLLNPFISLWLGNELTFDMSIVSVIVINFYIQGQRSSLLTFRDALGLFWYDRYKPAFESVINLIASIFLAIHFGVAGVLMGTIFSSLTTVCWVEPYIVYKYGFESPVIKYFISYLKRVTLILGIGGLTWYLNELFVFSEIWDFLFNILICALVPNLMIIIIYFRSDEFQYTLDLFKRFIKKSL
jgi:O-antigen/teichoic acid export membrane protein